jgi:hypothetical protein
VAAVCPWTGRALSATASVNRSVDKNRRFMMIATRSVCCVYDSVASYRVRQVGQAGR